MAGAVFGKDISVTLTARENSISLGEEFSLQVKVQGADNLEDVRLENAGQFSISNRVTSTQVQIINGKISRNKTINYSLYSKKNGSFTVGPAVVVADGKEYKSQKINLKVLAEEERTKERSAGQGAGKGFFIETKVNNLNPYAGEQIIYTFRFYYRVQLNNPQADFPDFKGFWKEELGKEKGYRKVINGKEWNVSEINLALFPVSGGEITIPKSTLHGEVFVREKGRSRGRGSLFDDFFDDPFFGRGFGRRKKVRLSSKPLALKVRPFPEEGKPTDFSGLVGSFKMNSRIDKSSLTKGESATLTITIKGRGNIFDAKIGNIDVPGFKAYEDKPVLKTSPGPHGISGRRVFKMALVPQETGVQEVPSYKLNYFDPKAQQYKVMATKPLQINVKGPKSGEEEKVNLVTSTNTSSLKRKIKVQGEDLTPLKQVLTPTSGVLSNREALLFWSLFFLFPLAYLGGSFKKRRNERFSQDSGLRRQEQALRKFQKGIKQVREGQNFVVQASSIFRDYIGDKVNVDGKALTPLDLDRILGPHHIEIKTIEEIKMLLQDFERAQYGGQTGSAPSEIVNKMKDIVKNMEKELR